MLMNWDTPIAELVVNSLSLDAMQNSPASGCPGELLYIGDLSSELSRHLSSI